MDSAEVLLTVTENHDVKLSKTNLEYFWHRKKSILVLLGKNSPTHKKSK